MTAYDRVLAEPGSIAARVAFAAEARKTDPARADLIDKQLRLREHRLKQTLSSAEAKALTTDVVALLKQHRARWAADVTKLAAVNAFHRGCVAEVTVPAAAFNTVMPQLFALAPIQHVNLTMPLELEAVTSSPHLARIASLKIIELGDKFGDAQAILLARSPYVANVRWMSLTDNRVGMAGVEALVASPHLARCVYLDLDGNPVNPSPSIQDNEGIRDAARPGIADVLERKFGKPTWLQLPDVNAPWPPDRDDVATTA